MYILIIPWGPSMSNEQGQDHNRLRRNRAHLEASGRSELVVLLDKVKKESGGSHSWIAHEKV